LARCAISKPAALALLCASLAGPLAAGAARGAQTARLQAGFAPERLGAASALSFGFTLAADGGGVPSPLTEIDLAYPPDLGFVKSGLGIVSCSAVALQAHGPGACPANSLIGTGRALVEFPVGPEVVRETAQLAIFAEHSSDGYLRFLVSATGHAPVAARIVMSTVLLAGHLQIAVPLVPSLPEAPDVAVVQLRLTLAGRLTYYRRVRGRMRAYRPPGIGLPRSCPRGGFRFAATFAFLSGERTSAAVAVPCPAR
jgi:hypothetical protein